MTISLPNEHRLTIIFHNRRFEIVATEQADGQWTTEVAESDRGRKKNDPRQIAPPYIIPAQPEPLTPMMAAVHGLVTAIEPSLIIPLEDEEV